MWIGWCFSNVFVTIGPPFGRSIHQVLAFWGRCNLAKKISGTRRFGGHKKKTHQMKRWRKRQLKLSETKKTGKEKHGKTMGIYEYLWWKLMDWWIFFISDKHFGSEHGVHPGIVGDLLLSKSKEKHGAAPVSMRTWHWKIPHYSDMFR